MKRSSSPALILVAAALATAGSLGCGTAAVERPPRADSAARSAEPGADEVLQPASDLRWLRCPLGMSPRGSACAGEARAMDWQSAADACPAGYRLPTRRELAELLGGCDADVERESPGWCASCDKSPTCQAMFDSDQGWYWSSTRKLLVNAWTVAFHNGRVRWNDGQSRAIVRCVR